ncbi:ubiquitin C-terminal hydrolase [Aspergillus heteromorphus CBS 117.55]|uniref:ubiquitinyl hydrolase 1 n=1 Tax=Aspergillus heteromorphus CBS 117.55 TaxID=1448321 RepID=A0A317UYH4_9EURO|nr:ubiquitin C-terminal hydrolase [Aspergillus heteromorphus CBS 117.55]PWY65577.1 ubiquitin C-terminal hydrolase [Aspergillus heteromorphus CBS 117.55]
MNARREGIDFSARNPFTNAQYRSSYGTQPPFAQGIPNLIASILLAVISVLFFLNYFGLTIASLGRLVWKILVHLTPTRLVAALDSKATTTDPADEPTPPMTFETKSEAMQRILGLNDSSFSSFLPRTPSLPGFGTSLLSSKNSTPPGLGNWDNSCYQNSIIQGLASLQSLEAFLRQNVEQLGQKVSLSTHQALKEIIERLNSAENYGQRLWIPADLKSMSSWQQQDAQEYFAKVVDQLDFEVQRATRRQTRNMGLKKTGPQEHVIGAGPVQKLDGDSTPEVQETGSQNQVFRNPLEGLLAQRVGCIQCGWTEGLSLIPFNCLTVPLGPKFEYDIRECLHHYMHLEPIEGVECAKCTLLRAQTQLVNLLKQIEDDNETPGETPDSSKISDALRDSATERLQAVEQSLEEEDFTEKTLSEKCHIPGKNRVSSTKSRQAVIARPPECLVIHVNRSLFDETTGMLRKNYAAVKFPKGIDVNQWCLGGASQGQAEKDSEAWETNPSISMLPQTAGDGPGRHYELRAVITHYGRHENGHYICYRKYSAETFPAHVPDAVIEEDGEKERSDRWYRLSDEDVQMVSEDNVLSQGGAFMLFYEAVDYSPDAAQAGEPVALEDESSSTAASDTLSMTSATAGSSSDVSQATSVSASVKVEPEQPEPESNPPGDSVPVMTDVD